MIWMPQEASLIKLLGTLEDPSAPMEHGQLHFANIQGCTLEERVCPAGCDGTAYWERTPYGNTKFGIPNLWAARNTAHFIGCLQGVNRGGAFGSWQVHNHMQNCNNGPDSQKPSFFTSDADWVTQN